jgi:hypothetical protein
MRFANRAGSILGVAYTVAPARELTQGLVARVSALGHKRTRVYLEIGFRRYDE